MKIGIVVFLLMQLATTHSQPNCWRGITPLHSACEDVKRALGVDSCTSPISRYTLPDFRVTIEFENESCDHEPRAWRVSPGTVTSIIVSPRKEMLPSEFGLDLSKYQKREDAEIVGVGHYENRDEGVNVNLYRGFVQDLFLSPPTGEEKLRCKPQKSAMTSDQVTAIRDSIGGMLTDACANFI
jgi:hypothetical protein